MCDSSRSDMQPHGKSNRLGRGPLLLTAVGFAAVLGAVAFPRSEPAHQAAAATAPDLQAMVVAASIGAVGEQVLAEASFDQSVQKVSSIVGIPPSHTRATAVLVGTGLVVAMSPLGAGLIHPDEVFSATKVLFPDVVKFVSL